MQSVIELGVRFRPRPLLSGDPCAGTRVPCTGVTTTPKHGITREALVSCPTPSTIMTLDLGALSAAVSHMW